MEKFALFGNPIKRSKSPTIHSIFSRQTKIVYSYKKIAVQKENFKEELERFFKNGGKGANITAPFKQKAFSLISNLTNRAQICQSVNTIKKENERNSLGDNTDGIGLITDLKRLNLIKKNTYVLLLGAGGAAMGIIPSLLLNGCSIKITNRSLYKAQALEKLFSSFGNIQCILPSQVDETSYDLVINATSYDENRLMHQIFENKFSSDTFFYDLSYNVNKITPFLSLAKKKGTLKHSDGLGMLIYQAAFSFQFWYGFLPNIEKTMNILKHESLTFRKSRDFSLPV